MCLVAFDQISGAIKFKLLKSKRHSLKYLFAISSAFLPSFLEATSILSSPSSESLTRCPTSVILITCLT